MTEWRETIFPQIRKNAKKERAEIIFLDESGLDTHQHRGKGYAPIGETPVRSLYQGSKQRVNYVATVNQEGDVRFMTYKGSFTAVVMLIFLKRLIANSKNKIYLILDNLNVHKSKVIKAWINENSDKIAFFHLPSYAPQLNPVEYLNCDIKNEVLRQVSSRTFDGLRKKTIKHLRKLQKNKGRVAKYFKNENIAYAAAA